MLNMKLLLLHPRMIVLLSFWILPTTLYRRSLLLLRIILMCCLIPLHMMILMNIICMCLLPTCNYYERGTTSPPLHVSNTKKLQETVYTMHWPLLCVHELFFYDMPMHRKRVRLRHCLIYVTLRSLLNYKSLLNWLWYTLGFGWIHYLSTICLA